MKQTTTPNTTTPPAVAMGELREIPLASIVPSATNPRRNFSAEALDELGASIQAQGITVPLIVRPLDTLIEPGKSGSKEGWFVLARSLMRPNKGYAGPTLFFPTEAEAKQNAPMYELIDGERRYRAAKSVSLAKAPCVVKPLTDDQVQKVQLLSFLREDISDLEAAEGYQRLIDSKAYTPDTLAKELGIGRATIFERLKLVKLTAAPRKALQAGEIPAATAALIAGVPNHLQEELTKQVLAGDFRSRPLSFRATKELIEEDYRVNLKGARFKLDDATLDPKAGACAVCPKKQNPGICTDVACYRRKLDLQWNRLVNDESAVILMPQLYAKKRYDYVKAGDACWEDGKDRPYGDLAKLANVPPSLTRDDQGDILEVFERESLTAALVKAGVLKKQVSANSSWEKKQREESKQRKEQREILRAVFAQAIPKIAVPAEKDALTAPFWRLMATLALNEFHADAMPVCTWLGIEVKGTACDRAEKALRAHLDELKDTFSLLQFTVKLWAHNGWLLDYQAEFNPNFTAIAQYCGVDLKKLEAEAVKARAKKKKPAKAKAAKPTKPTPAAKAKKG